MQNRNSFYSVLFSLVALVAQFFSVPALAVGTPLDKLEPGTYISSGPSNLRGRQFTISQWADEYNFKGGLAWDDGSTIPLSLVVQKTGPGVFTATGTISVTIVGVPCGGDITFEIRAFSDGLYVKPTIPKFYAESESPGQPILPPRISPIGIPDGITNDYCRITGYDTDPDPKPYTLVTHAPGSLQSNFADSSSYKCVDECIHSCAGAGPLDCGISYPALREICLERCKKDDR